MHKRKLTMIDLVRKKIGNLNIDLDIMEIIIHKMNLNKYLEHFLGELMFIIEITTRKAII